MTPPKKKSVTQVRSCLKAGDVLRYSEESTMKHTEFEKGMQALLV